MLSAICYFCVLVCVFTSRRIVLGISLEKMLLYIFFSLILNAGFLTLPVLRNPHAAAIYGANSLCEVYNMRILFGSVSDGSFSIKVNLILLFANLQDIITVMKQAGLVFADCSDIIVRVVVLLLHKFYINKREKVSDFLCCDRKPFTVPNILGSHFRL